MPRGKRYLVAGRTYHLTHRCHDRAFLFRFAQDRDTYRAMLRERAQRYAISVLNYCITSNHTHLLVSTRASEETLSQFMQSLEGDFAQYYNLRKKRTGSFWGDRYHATMIDGGEYLWSCMKYIDLNMVRAGVVEHPRDWAWTGYQELLGLRRRYRVIDRSRLFELLGGRDEEEFGTNYENAIRGSIQRSELSRDTRWTESLAVGSESFVNEVGRKVGNRMAIEIEEDGSGLWMAKEASVACS